MVDGSDPVRVFISYAHDSDEHVQHVRDLWMLLRRCGVDAKIDRVAAQRRQDWALWMGDQVRAADHILVVASRAYREHAEGRSAPDVGRGVQWEARLIRDAFYRDQRALGRFVPVVLPGQSKEGVPDFFAPASSTVYTVGDYTPDGAEQLLRFLLGRPEEVEPPLGTAPALEQRGHGPTTPAPAGGGARVEQHATADRSGTVLQAGRDVFSYTSIQHFHGVPPSSFEQEPTLTVRVDSIHSCGQGWFHAFRRDDAGAADQPACLGRLPGDVQDVDLLFRRQLAAGAYVLSDHGNPASVVLSLHNPTGRDVVLRDVAISGKRDESVVDGTAFLIEAGAWNEDPITFRLDAVYPLARLVEEGVDKGAYFDSLRVVVPAGGRAALPLRFDAVQAAHTFRVVLVGDWAGRSFSTTVDNDGQPFRVSPVIRRHGEEPNGLAPAQPVRRYERAFDMAYDDSGPVLVERGSGDADGFTATP